MEYSKEIKDIYRLEKGLKPYEVIDNNDLVVFEARFSKRNVKIGQFLLCGSLNTGETLVELCCSKEYGVLGKSIIKGKREYITSPFGLKKIEETQTIPEGFLIANGAYLEAIECVLKDPTRSFAVGIYGENNEFVRKTIKAYKKLRRELIEMEIKDLQIYDIEKNDELALFITHIGEGQQKIKRREDQPLYKSFPSSR